jgi:hypothetical protein
MTEGKIENKAAELITLGKEVAEMSDKVMQRLQTRLECVTKPEGAKKGNLNDTAELLWPPLLSTFRKFFRTIQKNLEKMDEVIERLEI